MNYDDPHGWLKRRRARQKRQSHAPSEEVRAIRRAHRDGLDSREAMIAELKAAGETVGPRTKDETLRKRLLRLREQPETSP